MSRLLLVIRAIFFALYCRMRSTSPVLERIKLRLERIERGHWADLEEFDALLSGNGPRETTYEVMVRQAQAISGINHEILGAGTGTPWTSEPEINSRELNTFNAYLRMRSARLYHGLNIGDGLPDNCDTGRIFAAWRSLNPVKGGQK